MADTRMASISEELEREKARMRKEQEEREMAETKRRFDERMGELADLVLEYQQTRGLEDSITMMLTTFLDVALRMQEAIKSIEAISVAMNCVTEAISFLDSLNEMDSQMLTQTMQEKYTFWKRVKQKRMYRKAAQNHKNRIRQVINGLRLKMEMSQEMLRQMEGFSKSMQGAFGTKRGKKGSAQPAVSATTQTFLAERAKARGVDVATAGRGTAAPASAPAAGNGSGSFDDIL